jgi:hypothetical protein
LKYVNKLVFYNDIKELTIEEIENKLWYNIKIIWK